MVKFIKCMIMVNRLMIEVFDEKTGKPVTEKKTDIYGNEFTQTKEVIYRRGEEALLPETVVNKLGDSVEVVMAPVTMDSVSEPVQEPPEGEMKDKPDGETVADMIPKETPTKTTTKKAPATKK